MQKNIKTMLNILSAMQTPIIEAHNYADGHDMAELVVPHGPNGTTFFSFCDDSLQTIKHFDTDMETIATIYTKRILSCGECLTVTIHHN